MRKTAVWGMAALLTLGAKAAVAQVSLYTAVDMSLRNSAAVRQARADVARAGAALEETRDAYVPSLALGSSVGYSYGFPLGQPSIYNVTMQSLLFAFSQPDYIRAARQAVKTAQLNLKDAEDQLVLDTAVSYIQLDALSRKLAAMADEQQAAKKLAQIELDRVEAGVDARPELTRAELAAAQVELKRIHEENNAQMLRQKLANLTGLPPGSFVTEAASIPPTPEYRGSAALDRQIGDLSPGVQAAAANASSKRYLSRGDERQNHRPQIGFAANYSRFAAFNNYQSYYLNFQRNNFGIGLQVTFPLFDLTRRARTRESAADAVHAQAQAQQARDQASERVLELRSSLAELSVQQRVAELQRELAEEQYEAVEMQIQSGSGIPNAPPVTPKDAAAARIEERQRYEEMLDAEFSLKRAQLGVLRMMDAIDDWWRKAPQRPAH